MELPQIYYKNKVYSLKPKFISDLQNYFRKIKLSRYKKKKVNEEKTPYHRYYHMKFKIKLEDEFNSQVIPEDFEMIVPASAIFFAKKILEKNIKEKISIDVIDWNEITDDENQEYIESREEFLNSITVD